MSKRDAKSSDLTGFQNLSGLVAPAALPERWRVARLGDVIQTRRDLTQPSSDGKARYVGLEHIDSGNARLSRWGTENEVRSSKNKFFAGDVLYGKLRPYLDKVVLAEWEGMCATDILVFVADKQRALPEFAVHLLHTRAFLNHAISTTSGTNHPRTSWQALQSFALALPPLPEQRAIARVLSTLQRAIETQDKLIATARQVKKVLMRHLFTYGAVPPADAARVPLKETEIGAVPEAWEVMKLGDVCEKPQYGYTESATTKSVGPKFLRISDIQDGGVNWPLVPYCEISESFYEKYALKDGDLVVARIGATTGKSYFISNPPRSVFASYLIRVRAKMKLSPEYLRYFANTENYWKQINESKGGRLKQGINLPILTGLRLQLPPIPEQRAIARILAAVDQKIAAEEKRKAALQTLFRTMLHQLMTGQVRIVTG